MDDCGEKHKNEFDLSQITENIFLGTNLCCGKTPHMKILMDIGITGEIDLEEDRQESPPKVVAYLWLPVKDKHAPSQEQLEVGVAMLEKLTKNDKKIYVHCKYGHGRSPTLVAAYFISQGMGVDDAIAKVKEARPEIHLEESQKASLVEYEKRHKNS